MVQPIKRYPERLDIVRQADQLAAKLGGKLEVPHSSWKYSWIERPFGWRVAKRAQVLLPAVHWPVERFGDKLLAMPWRHAKKRISHITI